MPQMIPQARDNLVNGNLNRLSLELFENLIKSETRSVQRLSKCRSGCYKTKNSISAFVTLWLDLVQNDCKAENGCAQPVSKVSEWDGCPSGYAGRMGETVYAQRLSPAVAGSECGCPKWEGYAPS